MVNDNRTTIITTHANADFDALASMLAAQKLYPGSRVVFPGSHEKNLRNFFINSMAYLFNMVDIKEIDFDEIKRLVLVDTRQPGRIVHFAPLLTRPDLEIHIYDHHPPMADDIQGHFQVIRETGATVTLLTEIIREKGIGLSEDEATIMCLGLYEDTGSFTFASTTESDFHAAAYLLSKGASLNTVADLISREISPEQVGILNDMIQGATRHHINGIEVVLTRVTSENYIPDFAFLVHKMIKMENIETIFSIAGMGNKIYLVARSRLAEVDVGAILTSFGGGGHKYAASAAIKGKTLAQVEQQLLQALYAQVQSSRLAWDFMSSPPITVNADVSCKEAANLLTRYNINALLVMEKPQEAAGNDRLSGFISRQIIEKALFHKLALTPVREYMTTDMATVGPAASLLEIQEKIIENKQRILPVMEKGTVLGVITRTDLLNILIRQSRRGAANSPDPLQAPAHARTRNIGKFMQERLSKKLIGTLKIIGETASDMGCGAFIVGGFVRDLFLYRTNEDIDLVIEGDGIAFAKKFSQMMGARFHSHEKFGTAVIIFADGFKIDVASARLEYYDFPAALPVVEMSSIKLDLFRRDFTINTLAIQLNTKNFGLMIDFFGGQKDIKEKTIRVLHNLSFVEDPTRVFRAIRFEQRFNFSIGKLTAGLIANAVRMDFFKRLSGRRVFMELRQILQEENPTGTINRLKDFKLLHVIHPSIEVNEALLELLDTARKVLSWYDLLFLEESYMKWSVYFMALIRHCDRKTSDEICLRLELAPRHRKIFAQERFNAARCLAALERKPPTANSMIYKKLSAFRTELILYMMAITQHTRIKRNISHYFTQLRYIKISLTGKDLKKLGLEPGPVYRQVLDAALDAKLNGHLKSRDDELSFARNYAS
ncbi:MAG: CBS domain-containing protein [Desulfobacterales bacterium]|nr:CBS domain-containing protein [Desulfobacterales bacterium]